MGTNVLFTMFKQLFAPATMSVLLAPLIFGAEGLTVHSIQSFPLHYESVFPSSIIYEEERNEVHLLSNVAVGDQATRCFYQTLSMGNFSIINQRSFGNDNEVCHSLALDDKDSHIYMAGHSYKGGLLGALESNLGLLGVGDSEYYGMVVDMGTDGGTELHGGRLIYGTKFVYPLAVLSHEDTVYSASLYSGIPRSKMNESETLENPSQVFPDGEQFDLLIEAYTKKPDHTHEGSEGDEITTEAFETALKWDHFIGTSGNTGIHNIAGILPLDDSILVAGSTNGYGSGLGVASSINADMDGFVVKLSYDGELYGEGSHSHRIKSSDGYDEYINGICKGESDDVVYVTGSTNGRLQGGLKEGNEPDGVTRAYILKLNVTTMEHIWVRERGAYHHESDTIDTPAEGVACHLSHLGGFVYMAGNVYNGGTMSASTLALSLGGSDVFVAKFHTSDDHLEWVRQIGSTGDEMLAPRGGLAFTKNLGVVLFGQTNGELYRSRGNESSSSLDFFISVIDHDGVYPDQIQDQTAITPTPTMAPTTAVPSTAAPTTVKPGCTTSNCTSYSFVIPSIKLRLEGVGKFADEAGDALAKAIKKWYEAYYLVTQDNRRLNKDKIHQFQTDVSYWGASTVGGGSTITYNQSVAFDSDHDNVDYDFAASLLVDPLLDDRNKADFLKSVSESHVAFEDATEITGEPLVPDENRPKNAAGQTNFSVFIFIGVGILSMCVCWGIYTAKHLEKSDQIEDYDEKDDADRPEAPLDLDIA